LKRKGAIRVGRDHDRDRHPLLHLGGLGVELLAEVHDRQSALAERRTDRRRRIGRAGRHLQFQIACDFLCHVSLLEWCGSWRLAAASPPTSWANSNWRIANSVVEVKYIRQSLLAIRPTYSFFTFPKSNSTVV